MGRLRDTVFSYPKLEEKISENSQIKEEVLKNLKEIRATLSPLLMRILSRFLNVTLSKLYDDINLSVSDEMKFNELVEKHNVVLVPNHQSHADYVALSYIIYKTYKIFLYVAGGINLNIFFIGRILRACGCFFIRRKFNNDEIYKLTFEAYLYYLLLEGRPIEFFFEGGRSRTGKLLPPRYGLYQMLLEAHQAIPPTQRKKLLFIPVSIVHEYVAEQRAHVRELQGGNKKKESIFQALKLFKIFAYQFGSVHIRLGNPVEAVRLSDDRKVTQNLAFDCFRAVGKNMLITPSSLLSLILLDDPTGAMEWEEILANARKIVHFCKLFSIPLTDSLAPDKLEESLDGAIDLLLANQKINIIGGNHLGHVFYSIKKDARLETLYFKNTILHHFLVPWIINLAWINIFNGNISNVSQLESFFLMQRNQLTHEFYLPTVKEFVEKALKVISHSVGREIDDYNQVMHFSYKDLYSIVNHLGVFSRSYTYIQERYYLSARTLKALNSKARTFSVDEFNQKAKEIFVLERNIGRIIKYPESFSLASIKNSLDYFVHQKHIIRDDNHYRVINTEALDLLIKKYEKDLLDQFSFRIYPRV